MSLPYWVLNESKKRKKENSLHAELLPFELTLKYIDNKGRIRFKTKRLNPELKLKFRDLARLVQDIENETDLEFRKSFEGWFPSDAMEFDLKPEFSGLGEYLSLTEEHQHIRSELIDYDKFS